MSNLPHSVEHTEKQKRAAR